MSDKIQNITPNPELYKLYGDINHLIKQAENLPLMGVIGLLEMIKISLIESCSKDKNAILCK